MAITPASNTIGTVDMTTTAYTGIHKGFAPPRTEDIVDNVEVKPMRVGKPFTLGPFTIEAINVAHSIPESCGAEVRLVWLKPENGFLPDLAELEASAMGAKLTMSVLGALVVIVAWRLGLVMQPSAQTHRAPVCCRGCRPRQSH